MPYIQVDLQKGLDAKKKKALTESIVKVVNKAIGSSKAHINVVIREWPTANIVEAGESGRNLLRTE